MTTPFPPLATLAGPGFGLAPAFSIEFPFNTPNEVLYEILLQLGPRQLFVLQRVNRRWRYTILTSRPLLRPMWLLPKLISNFPGHGTSSDEEYTTSDREINPFIHLIFGDSFEINTIPDTFIPAKHGRYFISDWYHKVEIDGMRPVLDDPAEPLAFPTASWTRMLITQPPCRSLQIGETYRRYYRTSVWQKWSSRTIYGPETKEVIGRGRIVSVRPVVRHQEELCGFKLGDLVGLDIDGAHIQKIEGDGGAGFLPRGSQVPCTAAGGSGKFRQYLHGAWVDNV